MAKKKVNTKDINWANYKATQSRSSWRARAKKLGLNLDDVPTRLEIQTWLESQSPFKCYFTNTVIPIKSIELDHKIPLVRNGSLLLKNVGITTRYYNLAKGQMTEKEFKSLLKCLSKFEDKGSSVLKRLIASGNIYSRRKK